MNQDPIGAVKSKSTQQSEAKNVSDSHALTNEDLAALVDNIAITEGLKADLVIAFQEDIARKRAKERAAEDEKALIAVRPNKLPGIAQ